MSRSERIALFAVLKVTARARGIEPLASRLDATPLELAAALAGIASEEETEQIERKAKRLGTRALLP